jgi:uncharacterized protein YfaS (alpha-2-macroglobulin family)
MGVGMRQRALRFFAWLMLSVSSVAAGTGCRQAPASTLARVTAAAPASGEIDARAIRDGVKVTFDRPVAPAGQVGKQVTGMAFVIVPAVAGEARWLDPSTLGFFPSQPLQPSTTYTVRLSSGLQTAPEVAIEPWPGLRMVHDRINVEDLSFEGDREFQTERPVARLRLSQAARPADVQAACVFQFVAAKNQAGPEVRATVTADGERTFKLQPVRGLAAGHEYVLRCSTALKGAAGDAGLSKEVTEKFTTHGPAAIQSVSPTGRDLAADDVKVKIVFATPMDPAAVRQHVRLHNSRDAEVRTLNLSANHNNRIYTWGGKLQIDTEYELVIAGGLTDVFGQKIVDERRQSFRVGDQSPRLSMETGIFTVESRSPIYPIWTRNLPSYRLRCAAVPEARLAAVLTGPSNYDAWWDASDHNQDIDFRDLSLSERRHTLKTGGGRNRWVDQSLDLAKMCGGAKAASTYLLEIHTDGELSYNDQPMPKVRRSLASVTDLGLLAKVGNASSLVWVVRLSTGQPVAGATVKIRDLQGKVRFTGQSNVDGVVSAPGATKLLGLKPRGGATANGEEDNDEGGEEWDDYRARRVIVTAQAANDLAVLDTNWNNGIQIWNFSVPQDRRGGSVRVRGFLQSDRGIYRPGDTVHLKGLARLVDRAGKMTVPGRKSRVHLRIEDPRGRAVVEEDLKLTAFGGFNRDLELESEARLGDWRVRADLDGQVFSERFAVEEYKPRTFEVKVATPSPNIYLGQKQRFDVSANFLYGSPLRAGHFKWSLRRREHLPSFSAFDAYAFQDNVHLYDEGLYWARYESRSFSETVADGEGKLDETGKVTIETADPAKDLSGPQDYLFEVTVEDASGQGVSAGQVLTGHKANLYLGLHPAEFVQAVDMPFGVQVVGFDAEGKRRAAEAELTLWRRTYECTSGSYGCRRKEPNAPSVKRKIAVPAAGSAAVEIVVLRQPGEYVVRVTAPDGRGNQAVSSETIYVVGAGEAFWSGDEGDRMTLIASKSKYKPGDTAMLVPQAQLPGSLALVTVERDGIMSYAVKPVANSGQGLEVKVTPEMAPNAFASVVLVRGRTGEGNANGPRFKMGLVNLQVDTAHRRLRVVVETDRPGYEPGDEVKARVKITDAKGAPVRAEVALAVADEGVLQIAGYKTPDPMQSFYAPWGLGVESATTWNRLLRVKEPGQEEPEEGGDGGGDEAGRVRSRFMATAFWTPALVTGADGTATVKFGAPDNLTAFRVMAVAADAGERFGSGDKRFTISKTLQAMPALPRFLSVGDAAQATVMVHNNSKAALQVRVSATVTGVDLAGQPQLELDVPAGAARPAVFPVLAKQPGEASFTFKAVGGAYKDAVITRLPVNLPALPETLGVGEGSTTSKVEHKLPAVGAVIPGRGGLEITFDRTGLSRLDEGLAYLVGYPYGCLEQTTSKVVPMVALTDLAKTVSIPGVSADKARGFIEKGLAKMVRHQHEDGGFGLWMGAPAEVHYTAVALWGLGIAKNAGFSVDADAINSGVNYLKARINRMGGHGGEFIGERASRAFAAAVLAGLGQADDGLLTSLYNERALLSVYGRAFLLQGLHKAGRGELAATLAEELLALVPSGNGPAIVKEGREDLSWYWSSDVRTTALVLSALLPVQPANPAINRLADGLLAARVEGRWQSTQENMYGLLAMAELARARVAAGEVQVAVNLGGQTIATRTLAGADVARVSVPLAETKGPLSLTVTGGEIFYTARIKVERPLDDKAASHGLTIERAYLDPDTGKPLTKLHLGQTVKVRLTVHSPERRAHVAVVDRLPGGFEPVLTRFRRSYTQESPTPVWWGGWRTIWQNQELRDDRAQVFADLLGTGDSQHEYLVRATSVGRFTAPPATVEAMYQPTINGHSAALPLEIER